MKIERLGQVMIEPGAFAKLLIVLRTAAGQRDGNELRMHRLRASDELESVAIGQAEVAQKDIDRCLLEQVQRLGDTGSGHGLMSAVFQQIGEHCPRILMILNDENSHGLMKLSSVLLLFATSGFVSDRNLARLDTAGFLDREAVSK